MSSFKVRRFSFDGDELEVIYRYDEVLGIHFGDYPDFEETPRYTPQGRPWVNTMQDACSYGVNQFNPTTPCLDCGSCSFYLKERPGDLIGICINDQMRRNTKPARDMRNERMMNNETEDQAQT